jgi:hypothetical protein
MPSCSERKDGASSKLARPACSWRGARTRLQNSLPYLTFGSCERVFHSNKLAGPAFVRDRERRLVSRDEGPCGRKGIQILVFFYEAGRDAASPTTPTAGFAVRVQLI